MTGRVKHTVRMILAIPNPSEPVVTAQVSLMANAYESDAKALRAEIRRLRETLGKIEELSWPGQIGDGPIRDRWVRVGDLARAARVLKP